MRGKAKAKGREKKRDMKECMKRRKFAGRINRNGENPGEIVVIQDSFAASDPLPFRMGDAPYSFLRVKCTGFLPVAVVHYGDLLNSLHSRVFGVHFPWRIC